MLPINAFLFYIFCNLPHYAAGLYRTHIGSSTSPVDAQVYDSPESMAHFGRFAGVFAQLKEYRMELMQEAAQTGHPLVRWVNLRIIWFLQCGLNLPALPAANSNHLYCLHCLHCGN